MLLSHRDATLLFAARMTRLVTVKVEPERCIGKVSPAPKRTRPDCAARG